jgi:hypothetical protein
MTKFIERYKDMICKECGKTRRVPETSKRLYCSPPCKAKGHEKLVEKYKQRNEHSKQ